MASTQSQGKRRRSTPDAAKNGSTAPVTKLDADTLLALYTKMVEIRLFEDAAQRGFRQGKVGGYMHVYSGQEAVATGFLNAFKEGGPGWQTRMTEILRQAAADLPGRPRQEP